MSSLPTGTVTFLFTDLAGSTRLLHELGDKYAGLLREQRRLLRDAFQHGGGQEVDTQGDAFFVAFPRAEDAVLAAVAAQRAMMTHAWPEHATVAVRMGLHTGEPLTTDEGYVGADVHRAARICAAGHGGQILLSQTTRDLIEQGLPHGLTLRDLGEHRLKDLVRPEHVFQVIVTDLRHDFPPLKSMDAQPNNLPVSLTSFIGREREKTEVKRLLQTTRLLTLTGAGGAGKTRLALQVAAEVLENFQDGVWLAEMASLANPALVPQVIASSLFLREQPGRAMLETLTDFLQPKQLLLVLDNCEHLLEPCAHLADRLLRAAPNLRILATSREALGIGGETTWRVPSLSLPDPDLLPPVESLAEYEAIRLFLERARAALPAFRLTGANAPGVVQLCRRLDGIPLALELAAARVKALPVDQLVRRLDDRFRLLISGDRTGLPRQRTLRAAMDWSHDLLTEQERVVLRRLSAFAGGCTLEAVDAVCSAAPVDETEVVQLLTQLVDKSLVVVDESPEGRYRLLETVRQFGIEKLYEAGETEELRRRHRDFFLVLAEEAEPTLTGADQKRWLDHLEVEHDNLRAALDGSLERGDAEPALRLAGALWRFWSGRDHITEGRTYLKRALEHSVESRGAARAKALHAAGNLAWDQGDYKEARALLSESLEVSRALGDKPGIAAALNNLGNVVKRQGDYAAARALFEESLALSRDMGHDLGIARTLNNLGTVAYELGDYPEARAFYQESLALCRGLGHGVGIAITLTNLGDIARQEGDYGTARALYHEGLAVARDVGHKPVVAGTLRNLGELSEHEGDFALAQSLFEEACQLSRQLGDKAGIASALEGLGGVSAARGHTERGARLFGAAEATREGIGGHIDPINRPDYERRVARLHDAMTPDTFAAAWKAGRAMTVDQAVEYALGEGAPLLNLA